jgi:membrane protein required for colicin V production
LNLLDILLIIIPVIGFILGFKDGFVRKIIGLVGILIGIYLGVFFAGKLGRMIESAFDIEYYLASIIAGVAIFLVIVLIFSIIKRLVHPFDKVNNFVNQMAGGFLGAIQILFFTSAVLYLLNVFNVPKKNIKESSFLYTPVYSLIPSTIDFVGSYTPYANERKPVKIIRDSK